MIHFAKEKTSLLSLRGITWAAVLSAVLLLSGCSGTGTMYTPESEESSFSASTGSTSAAESAAEAASGGAGAEAGSGSGHDSGHSMQGKILMKKHVSGPESWKESEATCSPRKQ